MKKALLPLMGSVLVLAILISGVRYRKNYLAPWDAKAVPGTGTSDIRSTVAALLLPSRGGTPSGLANASDVEGRGELVESAGSAAGAAVGAVHLPEEFYPYRAMLNERQQVVYDQAYANAAAINAESFGLADTLTEAELIDVMSALINDQPQFFYLETRYSYGYLADGRVVSLQLSYNGTLNGLKENAAAFELAAERILSGAKALSSAVEREQYVHDRLLETVGYDTDAVNNQSAYSALVAGSSVCAGYARAMQYLLIQLGIPCYYCEGTVDGGNHAWNIVALSDGYYNVDPSWNDVSGDGSIGHSYFNISDQAISNDHTRRGLSVNLPACGAAQYARDALYGAETASDGQSNGAASYESLGYAESDVIRSLPGYYDFCKSALSRLGTGTHSLTMVIEDIDLVNEIYSATRNKDYIEGYARDVARRLALSNCTFSMKLSAEYLRDGFVLLTQETLLSAGQTEVTPSPAAVQTATPLPEPTAERLPEPTAVLMPEASAAPVTVPVATEPASTPTASAFEPTAEAEPVQTDVPEESTLTGADVAPGGEWGAVLPQTTAEPGAPEYDPLSGA